MKHPRLPSGQRDTIREMRRLSEEQLKLWVIQELSSDDCAFWLVGAGIEILENLERIQNRRQNE